MVEMTRTKSQSQAQVLVQALAQMHVTALTAHHALTTD
jgi:hypothetical protein